MASWREFDAAAPELAAAVARRLTAHRHHVLATLRRDGSPRISGIEVAFYEDDLVIGSMPGAVKVSDLRRDGRFAVHTNPGEGSMAGGDAKLSGVAREITDPDEHAAWVASVHPPSEHSPVFRLDLAEAVLTSIPPNDDRLVIEFWRPGRPVTRVERT